MLKSDFLANYQLPKYKMFFDDFLDKIPDELFSYLHFREFKPRERIISSAACSESVYFLLKGKLYAVEERIQSQPCIFTELHPIAIVGDFELFSAVGYSYASVMAADFCECISMPSDLYLRWISQNAQALFYRTKFLMKLLGNQMSAGRQFFFMDYTARCVSVLLQYTMAEGGGTARIALTREELAGKIGCSLRTCQRIVKELSGDNMIELVHGKIMVRPEQRSRLKQYLENQIHRL